MHKTKNSTAVLGRLLVLGLFAAMAMASTSNKDFNEGFRNGYNAVTRSYTLEQNLTLPDSLQAVAPDDLASLSSAVCE